MAWRLAAQPAGVETPRSPTSPGASASSRSPGPASRSVRWPSDRSPARRAARQRLGAAARRLHRLRATTARIGATRRCGRSTATGSRGAASGRCSALQAAVAWPSRCRSRSLPSTATASRHRRARHRRGRQSASLGDRLRDRRRPPARPLPARARTPATPSWTRACGATPVIPTTSATPASGGAIWLIALETGIGLVDGDRPGADDAVLLLRVSGVVADRADDRVPPPRLPRVRRANERLRPVAAAPLTAGSAPSSGCARLRRTAAMTHEEVELQLGMIGLGRMGANLVRRLMRDGHECVVYDVDADAIEALAGEGATGGRLARGARREAGAAARRLDHGPGRLRPGHARRARRADGLGRRDHRRRQLLLPRRHRPRGGARAARASTTSTSAPAAASSASSAASA